MKSVRERQELKQWGGELISFAPTPGMKFGLSDVHIRQAHIRAHVETSDAGTRVTATRAATIGIRALAAKKKRPDTIKLVLTGDAYAKIVESGTGKRAREQAELYAARVNAISGEATKNHADDSGVDQPTSQLATNPLDQIKQLAELRDAGAITSEEFEAKKADLLRRV